MFIRTLYAERLKLRHSPVWLAFLALPLLAAIMGTVNYLQNLAILQDGWYSLWSQHTLFYCYFFMPTLIGVYCAYLCRLEHLNHNWNVVMAAPVTAAGVYGAKLCAAAAMVIFTQAFTGLLFVAAGRLAGLSAPLPPELAGWLLAGTGAGVAIAALQLTLSLAIRSFAVPVAMALAGGVVGIAALAKGLGAFWPYTLFALGMRANDPTAQMTCGTGQFVASCALFLLIGGVAGILWLKHHDMTTA